jgi:hypothetical protein
MESLTRMERHPFHPQLSYPWLCDAGSPVKMDGVRAR